MKVLPRLQRRRSKIAGTGVFALQPINKHTRVVTYAGEKISHRETARREARQLPRGRIWCFIVNRRWARDASRGGNIARYINHSCRPNCYTKVVGDVIWIYAARNIKRGEELSYHYRTGGAAGIPCACRPGCTTVL